jgi:hypothetical protein
LTIFQEFSGRQSYLTREETDRLNNPEKYGYDQARYDQFVERIQRSAEQRQATSESAKDAILTSYAGRGTGGTNPGFSFSSYGGQTSGGTAGLSGFAGTSGEPLTYTTRSRPEGVYTLDEPYGDTTGHLDGGTSNYGDDYGAGTGSYGGGDEGPSTTQVEDETTEEERDRLAVGLANGGAVTYVQNMEAGGPVGGSQISNPYASPMTNNLAGIKAMQAPGGGQIQGPSQPRPLMTTDQGMPSHGGIGGLFRDQFSQMGQQMNQMQSEPLNVYRNYLTQTYVGPSVSDVAQGASQEMTGKVDHFLDLVDQAERAHFEAEESFGFGGGPMAQPMAQPSMSPRGGMAQPAYMGQLGNPKPGAGLENLRSQTDAYSAQQQDQLNAMQMMSSMG